jgi:hypothetical protein
MRVRTTVRVSWDVSVAGSPFAPAGDGEPVRVLTSEGRVSQRISDFQRKGIQATEVHLSRANDAEVALIC